MVWVLIFSFCCADRDHRFLPRDAVKSEMGSPKSHRKSDKAGKRTRFLLELFCSITHMQTAFVLAVKIKNA